MTNYFWYIRGLKNRDAAETALEDLFAHGEVTPGERPRIQRYNGTHKITGEKVTRYGITLPAD